jgi:hypothetical protein
MSASPPTIRFLSLFVPNLADAARRYQAVLGVAPSTRAESPGSPGPRSAPAPHPFAAAGPVVFELGEICLALYQCDGRTTHPGDVGIGLLDRAPSDAAGRAAANGGRVFLGPARLPADGREAAFFMLPDRHFFEVLASE